MGGMQWDSLPLAVAYFGVTDVERLIDAVRVIAAHRPSAQDDGLPAEA